MSLLSSRSGTLERPLAAHLLKRTTFGPTKKEIDNFALKTPTEALVELLRTAPPPKPPSDPVTGQPWLPARKKINSSERALRNYVRSWWLDYMCRSGLSLEERMVFFYHTHFTTMESRVAFSAALYYQNALFRYYALGNYKKLATKICYDSAMLMHLDGHHNRVGDPNENFAREFLELYSIGKGEQIGAQDYSHYTEQDVKEAARVFSGFSVDKTFTKFIDPETGLPQGKIITNSKNVAKYHDFGVKTFSSKFNNKVISPVGNSPEVVHSEIEEFIEMVFSQPETARHICRKLYRFFVYYQISPEIESEVINPLANILLSNNYEIKPVLEVLLTSQHFYDTRMEDLSQQIGGTLVKSPLDLMTGMLRFYKMELPSQDNLEVYYAVYNDLLMRMETQGMSLYEMEDVAGYPPYYQAPDYNRNWIAASTLAQRYSQGSDFVIGISRRKWAFELSLDVMAFVDNPDNLSDPSKADLLLKELIEAIFPRSVSPERFNYFLNDIFLEGLSLKAWEMEWETYKSTGDESGVRGQLENLLVRLMETPEYQLF